MSQVDVLPRPDVVASRPVLLVAGRFLRNELRLMFRRRRNIALLVVLSLAPVLIGTALKLSPPSGGDGGGPGFLDKVTSNGLFLTFTALLVTLPVFLPLVISVVAGDSVAGEASTGTLRGLLTVPVGRTRLLLTKWVSSVLFAVGAVASVWFVALVTGALLFPLGRMVLLSGNTVSFGSGLLRSVLVAGFVAASLVGLVTMGVMFSTFTEVPVAAMALTLGFLVVTGVLDSVPQLHGLQPVLLTHHWFDFGELLRDRPRVAYVLHGLEVQLGYVLVAGSVAWTRFVRGDVTS